MVTVMIMTTEMMRMTMIESDSYHHWPAAPSTPHPEPFPLMSIHSNQRVGMITLTMAMVLMMLMMVVMLMAVVINTIFIIIIGLSLSDLVFAADIKARTIFFLLFSFVFIHRIVSFEILCLIMWRTEVAIKGTGLMH